MGQGRTFCHFVLLGLTCTQVVQDILNVVVELPARRWDALSLGISRLETDVRMVALLDHRWDFGPERDNITGLTRTVRVLVLVVDGRPNGWSR